MHKKENVVGKRLFYCHATPELQFGLDVVGDGRSLSDASRRVASALETLSRVELFIADSLFSGVSFAAGLFQQSEALEGKPQVSQL